jgi:hypothetical protein
MSPGGTNLKPMGDFLRPELEGDKAVQARILGLIDDAVRCPALGNAVMRHGSPDYWRESYVSKTGKSMKTVKLAASEKDCWRNIPITHHRIPTERFDLKCIERSRNLSAKACFQQLRIGGPERRRIMFVSEEAAMKYRIAIWAIVVFLVAGFSREKP